MNKKVDNKVKNIKEIKKPIKKPVQKRGRPGINTKKVKVNEFDNIFNKIEIAIAEGMNIKSACYYAGIAYNTLQKYIKEDKTGNYDIRLKKAKQNLLGLAFKMMKKELTKKNGDWKAAMEIIKRIDKRYNEKLDLNHKGKIAFDPVTHIIVEGYEF